MGSACITILVSKNSGERLPLPFTLFGMQTMTSEAIILIVTGVFGAICTTSVTVWFVSSQFSDNRKLMYDGLNNVTKTIMDKLEYHEQHDDIRFAQITERNNNSFKEQSDRIWNIELRNAAKDGVLPREYKKN